MKRLISSFNSSNDFKRLFNNIINFTSFQLTNYLVPLITIPYIVRIIGVEKFGIITFAQIVIQYVLIFVDYGFDISAIAKIAKVQGSKKDIKNIFNSVFIVRVLIMIIMAIFLTIISVFWSELANYKLIYLFAFGVIPAHTMLATWFFLGMEKTKYLNYSNFIARILYLVGIFVFIKIDQDYYLVPAINSISLILAGSFSLLIIRIKFGVQFNFPPLKILKQTIIEGWNMFIANFTINIYRNFNIFILGLISSKEIVGIYSAGEKIVKVFQSISTPITQTVYPYISNQKSLNPGKSIRALKLLITIMGTITFIVSGMVLLFSTDISLLFLGDEFYRSISVIKIGSFVVFFGMLNYVLGIIYMINFNQEKDFSKSVLLTAIFNIIVCTSLSIKYQEIGTSIAFLSSEIFLFIVISIFIYRRKNWKIR